MGSEKIEEYRNFRKAIIEISREVCGRKRIGDKETKKKKRESKWWSKEVRNVVNWKKKAFFRLKDSRDSKDYLIPLGVNLGKGKN